MRETKCTTPHQLGSSLAGNLRELRSGAQRRETETWGRGSRLQRRQPRLGARGPSLAAHGPWSQVMGLIPETKTWWSVAGDKSQPGLGREAG